MSYILLEHTRFVLDPKTEISVKTAAGNLVKVKYISQYDHTDTLKASDTNDEKIHNYIKGWLEDHFGIVTVFYLNGDEEIPNYNKKISNRQKFKQTMLSLGVVVFKTSKRRK